MSKLDFHTIRKLKLYTLLISRRAILNIKSMTSFAESNLSSCDDLHLVSCDIKVTFLLQLLSNKSRYELHEGTA